MQNQTASLLDLVQEYAPSEASNLPVFPKIAQEVYSRISNYSGSLNDVAALIGKDQTLAAQIIKLANSAFFAGINKVRTIRESILRLGSNQVCNYLVASCQKDLYSSKDKVIAHYLKVLWQHALATAKGSQWLLRKTGYSEMADEGFLAGLFHDIGKLLLLRVFSTIRVKHPDILLSDQFILDSLDSMHAEQGYALMKEWNIPMIYCEVARHHHDEETESSDWLLMAVRLVDRVCSAAGPSLKPDPSLNTATLPEVAIMSVKEIVLAELEVVIEDALNEEL
jgi:HD-like signal output (HDOD) protein